MDDKKTAHRILFLTWATAVGLRFTKDVLTDKQWPCPGRYWRISALYVLLSLFSEVRPDLAMMLGVGFLVAFGIREGSGAQAGKFFGVSKPSSQLTSDPKITRPVRYV